MSAPRLPVSVVVLTYNESANIERCLESLQAWAGELWVVDSGSTDDTLEKVARFTGKVARHPFETYALQRNWALDTLDLAHDWVLHVDADEAVSPKLQGLLAAFFQRPDLDRLDGALVRRRILFLGRELRFGGLYPTYHCRLFRRGRGRCEDRRYDQHFVVEGPLARLEADLVENTAPSLAAWTERHTRWAKLEAEEMVAEGRNDPGPAITADPRGNPIQRRRWAKRSLYGRAPRFLRAFAYFAYRFGLRGGFLDGVPGLIYHVLQGFWFRFYIDATAVELQHQERSRPSPPG